MYSEADETFRIRADDRPLYVLAEQALLDLIKRRELRDGDRVPGETELARLLGVSRSTIREALRNLELQARVRRVHGVGTIVTSPTAPIVTGLETLESLESLAQRQGWICNTIDVKWKASFLSEDEAHLLQRPSGAPAILVTRVKTRGDTRVAWMESVVPHDVLGLEQMHEAFSTSIIDMFKARGQPVLERALADIRVESAGSLVAERLDTSVGSAVLLLQEIFIDPKGQPFCLNRNWFVPGSVRFQLVRSLP